MVGVEYVPEPGYRLKLRRAKEHLDHVSSEAMRFLKLDVGPPIPVDPKPENEWTIVRRGEVKPLSPLWGTFLGDFIHNTRSALDNLVHAMIQLNEPSQGLEHVGFPAYMSEKEWVDKIVERDRECRGPAPTDGVSEPVLAAIKESQPYKTLKSGTRLERHPLLLLQAASNTDKHRMLHDATPRIAPRREITWGVRVPGGNFQMVPAGCFQIRKSRAATPGTPIKTGAEIGRMKVRTLRIPPPDAEVGVVVAVPMEIAFSVEGNAREIVHWDLWDMANEAWRVVLRVEGAAGIHGLPPQLAYGQTDLPPN
jgi:hypothetical protein